MVKNSRVWIEKTVWSASWWRHISPNPPKPDLLKTKKSYYYCHCYNKVGHTAGGSTTYWLHSFSKAIIASYSATSTATVPTADLLLIFWQIKISCNSGCESSCPVFKDPSLIILLFGSRGSAIKNEYTDHKAYILAFIIFRGSASLYLDRCHKLTPWLTSRLVFSTIYPLLMDRFERSFRFCALEFLMVAGVVKPGIHGGFWILSDFEELSFGGPCGGPLFLTYFHHLCLNIFSLLNGFLCFIVKNVYM